MYTWAGVVMWPTASESGPPGRDILGRHRADFGLILRTRPARSAGARTRYPGPLRAGFAKITRNLNGDTTLEEEYHLLVEPFPDAVEERVAHGATTTLDLHADFLPSDIE